MFIKLTFNNFLNNTDVRVIKTSRIKEVRPQKSSNQNRSEILLDDNKWYAVNESINEIFTVIQPKNQDAQPTI